MNIRDYMYTLPRELRNYLEAELTVSDIYTDASDENAVHRNISNEINQIAAKASPIGADIVIIEDSAASYVKKKVLLSAITGSVTDTNAIHKSTANEIHQITLKGSPVGADEVVIEDSADSWNKKRVALNTISSSFYVPIKITVGSTAGNYDSTTLLTVGSIIRSVAIIVTGSYNGSATIEVKLNGASPIILLGTGDNNPAVPEVYTLEPWYIVGAGESGILRVTVGGTPNVGAATVLVEFHNQFLP